MKISENWLREWVNPPLSTDELAEQLTMAGFEVDGVEPCKPDFEKVIVARLQEVSQHPQADGQRVCELDTGEGSVTVVTGADNAVVDACFALALPGARLPGGREISEASIRGVSSYGMLCSALELGLAAEADRLFELHKDASAGMNLADYLQLDDHIFDLSLTPNRGDCFSLSGIAREVSVLNSLEMVPVESQPVEVKGEQQRKVVLDCPQGCPRYAGRVIRGIDISARAPDWVLEKLRRADIRSINVVVDLTNFVMIELGQPMHAFDDDILKGEIVVRMPRQKERLVLLDGQDCEIREDTLLITDESGPVALAGVIGGLESAVSDNTRNIFLESAYFTPEAIAGRARSYGLHTDASLRYERGVDFTLQEKALERLSALIMEYCGGEASPVVVAESTENVPERPEVELELTGIERLLGIEIEKDRVKQILQSLGLGVRDIPAGFSVSIPAFRFDISLEADLIEEIARIYGYDNIPSSAPLASLSMFGESSDDQLSEFQQCLLNRGYNEVITYSFLEAQEQQKLLGPVDAIPLLNPISSDLGVMRCSLIPGLLSTLVYNHNRQQERIRLFEWGRVFRQGSEIEQDLMIAGIIIGNTNNKQWDREETSSDIYDIKSDLEALLCASELESGLEYRKINHAALHPGQSAEICLQNQQVGVVGSIHPALVEEYGLHQAAQVFELDLSLISNKKPVKFAKFSKYPFVKRDISILVDADIALYEVLQSIRKVPGELLSNLELFDLYQGEGIDPRKKSLALGLTFQASSSTLKEEEVESVMVRILETLNSDFGATLRD